MKYKILSAKRTVSLPVIIVLACGAVLAQTFQVGPFQVPLGRKQSGFLVHLLASAQLSHSLLWTSDARLKRGAESLGIAYTSARSDYPPKQGAVEISSMAESRSLAGADDWLRLAYSVKSVP